ncbi:Flp family type IVb pilin [Paraburkholderia phenazinium]|jgi:pilus assembly protein Flp/PilA|uniref:Pilus assembly protein Flp/PilA n=1 Tax=Paraburkholderia phenazinium TaxID=60549 RepID=A0A1N6KL59_9BURK|nr:Flp family type IVb pilin [Paraburkholderia phenazinium]SIO57294.1 pilus assembly protein Flp/PilA [Paraburkholderia phenazinium]
MKKFTTRFLRDNKGVTAIEYGLIAGLIALAIVGTITTVGTDLSGLFSTIASKIPTT